MVDFSRNRDTGRREATRETRDEAPRRGRDEEPRRERSTRDDDAPRSTRGGRDNDRGGSTFQYKPRTREQVEKRATMQGGTDFDRIFKDHIKVFAPKKGENRVRFLPATWPSPEHYGYDIFVHYGVGPDRQSYLDLQRMLDKPDPIDEERNALRREGRTDDQSLQEIRDLNSTRRVACFIVDRDNEAEGVQMWAMAQTLDQDISASSVDSETGEVLDIDDPDKGYDVSFRKDGEKLNTKYKGITIARRSSKLGDKRWLEYAIDNPIPDQLKFYTYDEIAKEFGGGGVHRERSGDTENQREERGGSRSRDREESGSRDDDRSRDRAGRDDASEDRASDRGRRGAGDRERAEPEVTFESVHEMTSEELDALVAEDERLANINPADAKDGAELMGWICEDLKLEKATERERVTTRRQAAPERENLSDKLAEMRERRGR